MIHEARELLEQTQRLLSRMSWGGVRFLPVRKRRPQRDSARDEREAANRLTLEPVRKKALQCQACRLSQGRKTVVFGEGSLAADLVFIGEGPGRQEDLQGRPFVGAAGKLLTKIIEAMGLTRESVYIMNVVKCRPPMNRPPEPDEIAACRPYLQAQLATIAPKVICALGRTAAQALLETEAPMRELRGKLLAVNGIPVLVTFHPAYLLRNPSAKKEVWADMQQVIKLLA